MTDQLSEDEKAMWEALGKELGSMKAKSHDAIVQAMKKDETIIRERSYIKDMFMVYAEISAKRKEGFNQARVIWKDGKIDFEATRKALLKMEERTEENK